MASNHKAEPPKTQKQLAMANATSQKNDNYKKLQAYIRKHMLDLDDRYNTKYTDYTQVAELWEAKPINSLRPKLLEELRNIEEVKFKADNYRNFSEEARDHMARRIAVRDDGDMLLTWFADGMDEVSVARMLGFPSVRLMKSWMLKNDKLCQTSLMDILSAGMEGLGRDYIDRAESVLHKIGVVETPEGELSSVALACEFKTAAEEGDEDRKFMLQQLAPMVESALKWDTEKKKALSKHFTTRAGHYSPQYRVTTPKENGMVVHGGVNITLDMGVPAGEAKPKTVNPSGLSASVPGITLDMET